MAISTLDKLYGYLKGYEIPCFTGSHKQKVFESIESLLNDEFSVILSQRNPGYDRSVVSEAISNIMPKIDKFLTDYYNRMRKISSSLRVKDLADKSKKDYETLQRLLSQLMIGDDELIHVNCTLVGYQTQSTVHLTDLCKTCPYYVKSKLLLVQDIDEVEDYHAVQYRYLIPEYKYLGQALLCMSHILTSKFNVTWNDLKSYHMLFNHILISAKIYELMNPSGEARELQIEETLDLLTEEPLDPSSPSYEKWDNVLTEVFKDIIEGQKEYIQDFKQAWDKSRDFIDSIYDYERDPYYSLKGTGQSRTSKIRYSIQSSIREYDVYHHEFEEFDSAVGYNSPYRLLDEDSSINKDEFICVRTILINNPGKFKGRVIHIFDNPIQDRCNFIHRRLQSLMENLECDCTRNQEKGREFLKSLTMDWFLTENPEEKIGIYCGDFSNATDTLDQNFQCKILKFIFGERGEDISSFWKFISRMPKYMQHVDGTYERYIQLCGQPQGCLGSFDSFALAHYFVFLMTMKKMDLTQYSIKEFCRVLGDDSVFNSIEPEYDSYDPEERQDVEGIARSLTEVTYMEICENLANWHINYSKSESTHYNSVEAKLEFAKVTYRNGDFFSPIPFRLAMRYGHSMATKLAVAIWRGERRETYYIPFMDMILKDLDDPIVWSIVKSGVIPFLDMFKDESMRYNPSWLARLRFCYAKSCLRAFLTFCNMSDAQKDIESEDSLIQAIFGLSMDKTGKDKKQIFSPAELELLNPNHKIWNVINHNEQLISLVRDIADLSIEDKFLTMLCSPLMGSIKDRVLSELVEIIELEKDLKLIDPDRNDIASTIFPDANLDCRKDMSTISSVFVSRGIAKRPRDETAILTSTVQLMQELDLVLGPTQTYWTDLLQKQPEDSSFSFIGKT